MLAIDAASLYIGSMAYWKSLATLAAAGFAVALAAGAASAKDSVKPAPVLPGVDGGYSIVAPAPEPADEPAVAENGDRILKVGNTEIRVGGYVRVDIGAGALRPGH